MSEEPEKPDNLQLWNDLGKTNPSETKQFKRAGGFSGTAIKPMWVWQRLTEKFGPMGTGWGCAKPEFQLVNGENREVLVYCTVQGWYEGGDEFAMQNVYGVGGDKVVSYIKANEQYNRPERWENDDEAFKKAYTDALMNAFKFIGVGADVHMGRFDDNKYVQQMEQEFNPPAEQPKRPKLEGPYTSKTALWQAVRNWDKECRSIKDGDALSAFTNTADSIELWKQCERDAPQLLYGGEGLPPEFEPLQQLVNRMSNELEGI